MIIAHFCAMSSFLVPTTLKDLLLKTIKLIPMKRMLTTTAMALSLMLLASLQNTLPAQPRAGAEISYQTFYDELDPYGRWMDYPDYGYVWIPDAGPDFQPYTTNGHWVWSDDYEWMWVSDYDWGWAPFHYGRWLQDPSYGWVWVPGYEWSPAWVAWRDGGDYYGWAPLRPGINISINFSLGGYNPPIDYWCFAPRRYITSPRIYDYCMPRRNNVTIINHTIIINNYNYNHNVFRTGPGRRDAERYTGRINPVRFRESSRPGRTQFRNNEVSVYRPGVQHDNNQAFAPRKFEHFDRDRQNNGNAIRRNDNNLPERREGSANRGFDRRNNDGQPGNNNGIADRRRNNPNDNNGAGNTEPRPRTFERRDNNGQVPERRNVGRNNNNGNNDPQRRPEARPFERRNIDRQPAPDNGTGGGRRDIFNRNNNNNPPQPNRREIRNENRPQPQPSPQAERRQEPPRQFERRNDSNGGGRNNDNNGAGRGGFGRRGR
jgi:hypothetical protein